MTMSSRWDPETGQVAVTVDLSGPQSEVLRFDVVDRTKGLRVVMDGSLHYEGPERTTRDRGPLRGLVLEFHSRQRFVHGRPGTAPSTVPETVRKHLLEQGAEAVSRQ